jgi:nuclear cap-binding protein subunit 1
VDTIFSLLLRLPETKEREVFYASLLTEVTKLAPQDIAPTLGRAIRWIYDHLDDLKGELNMRFTTWFALHLSNFGFTYKWDEWLDPPPLTTKELIFRKGELELEDGAPKKVFLKETIEKEVRLSYLERIQRTLPEEYFSVFPEKPNIDEWKPISGLFLDHD